MSEIHKLKKLELEILIDIDMICKENNLKYYLVGGTLLGAVRHNGFIPWDDDIDIGMPRKDLNILEDILRNEYYEKYFVQNPRTDKNYWRYITKVRMNGTKMIEKVVEDIDMHHGIYIDIFPLDKINNNRETINSIRSYLGKVARLIKTRKIFNVKKDNKVRSTPIYLLSLIIPTKLLDLFIEMVYQCSNIKNNKYYTSFGSKYGWEKQTFPIEVYGEGTRLKFEGHQFIAPAKWEVILKSLYGDYMELPPEGKKNSGHNLVEIEFGKYN